MPLIANEYIALPEIRDDAGVLSMNFLSMRHKGMVEILGKESLVSWHITADGAPLSFSASLDHGWIPSFIFAASGMNGKIEYIAPLGQRVICMAISMRNESVFDVEVTLDMFFDACRVMHTVNESKEVRLERRAGLSSWSGMPVFGYFEPCMVRNLMRGVLMRTDALSGTAKRLSAQVVKKGLHCSSAWVLMRWLQLLHVGNVSDGALDISVVSLSIISRR